MPWQITAAGLTALLTLLITAGPLPMIFVYIVLILLSYFTNARLEGSTFNRWWVRIGFLIIIALFSQTDPPNNDFALGGAKSRNTMALFYAAEFTVQCWRRSGNPVFSRMFALTMSCLLMLTASNTFEDRFIRYLAPLYLLFVGLALYTHRNRNQSRFSMVARVVTVFLALSVGGITFAVVDINRARITELGNRMLGDRMVPEATGMASTPQLGETFGLRGSTARVLRIQGKEMPTHLRGMVFDTYIAGRWLPSFNDRQFQRMDETVRNPPPKPGSGVPNEITITRLASENPLIYIPLNTVSLETGEATDVEWSAPFGGPIRSRARAPYEYRIEVSPKETYQGILALPFNTVTRPRFVELPVDFDTRVRDLARRVTAGARTDREKIEAVSSYLLSNYSYSLRFNPGRGEPLVNFLLAEPKRPAHCEYFASAAAVLLRCVNVPSRYVTGYYAHEGEGENQVLVRQRDAHAWAEAWINGVGWVTVEATPGDGRPDHDPPPVEPWRRAWEAFQDGAQALAELLAGLSNEQIAAIIGAIVGLGLLYAFYLNRRRRERMAAAFAYAAAEVQLTELQRRFALVLKKRNIAVPPSRPYVEYLESLPASGSEVVLPAARHFARLYDEARFGHRHDPATLQTLRILLEELENTK